MVMQRYKNRGYVLEGVLFFPIPVINIFPFLFIDAISYGNLYVLFVKEEKCKRYSLKGIKWSSIWTRMKIWKRWNLKEMEESKEIWREFYQKLKSNVKSVELCLKWNYVSKNVTFWKAKNFIESLSRKITLFPLIIRCSNELTKYISTTMKTHSVHASIQINDYSRIYPTEIRVRHVNFTLHYSTYYITYSKQLYVKRHFINIQFARISDAFVTRNCCKRWSISLDFHGDEKRRNRE